MGKFKMALKDFQQVAHKYSLAIDLYTQAIELNSENAVYWANRAFAHTKLEEYGCAILDATKAVEIDPKYSKASLSVSKFGYYRRGAAYLAMGKFKMALKDFQQVKKICPNDLDAAKKLKECEKAVMKLNFEEAIAVPESERRSIVDSIDYRAIDVEPQYASARIENDVVTLDFVKKMMDDFKNQKCLHKRYAYQIVLQTREMLQSLPSLVDLNVPTGKHFTVCGDVHDQFYDLLNIFELNGLPSEDNPYLFNGDTVDRGSFSLEVILTLFSFKCMSPSAIYIARGNHESRSMNKIYGFEGEVKSKLSDKFVELFAEVFCCLPLAHVINEKIFVVHGGLFSVDGVKLSGIRKIDRFCEPPEEDLVVRSHEVKDEGYEIEHDGKLNTVFSAPNYRDQMGNKGAFIVTFTVMEPSRPGFELSAPIGQLLVLQKLDFSSNSLTGTIPDSFQLLKSLIFLALSNNKLHGRFPRGLTGLQNLQYFIMDDNPMFIPLPLEFGHLRKLQELRLANSGYSGTIPPIYSQLTNLSALSLQNNRLTGKIPTAFGNLSHIYHLNLSRNFLGGVVPFNSSFLKRLGRNLDLSSNPGLCLSPSEAFGVNVGIDVCGSNKTASSIRPLKNSESPFQCPKPIILTSFWVFLALHHILFSV
ncbi:serine threonine- phosphatase 5 isoform X2 [Olea europaea subsp. europaea]|uniref:protein-serine/threonine phosphatase n=1 Tax=Olea europaea subsp. europaea TaxID=158383 RepID=A0A8S0RGR8_OLEEU|nr:serine threonine- phosphatase 5 isoform X2 [Olea europaea subsp. europaea]